MKDILEEIIAHKRIEVEEQKKSVSIDFLLNNCDFGRSISMRKHLNDSQTGIIAEFKRRSPSKGWIKQDGDSAVIPYGYEKAGASALSILTDEKYFGGNLKDIRNARSLVNLPILRKDFVIDEYQLYQAKAVGANAVLLIAAALQLSECEELAIKAHELNLEVLLEIHSEREIEYVNDYVDMVGVNNRNLGTFHTDVQNSYKLAALLPKDKLLVSESGISDVNTVKELREVGFRGFLIGETFMKTSNPEATLEEFISKIIDK